MAALEEPQGRALDPAGQVLLRRRQGDAVIAARGDQGRRLDLVQPVPGVMMGAGLKLTPGAHFMAGFLAIGISRTQGDDLFIGVGVGFRPGGVAAGVGDRRQVSGAGLALQMVDLMEGEGGPARPAGRGAGQDQAVHPARMPQDQLLGHHAAEGDPDDVGALDAQFAHQGAGVVGIVGHAVGDVGLLRTSQTALVEGDHVEGLGKRPVELVGLVAQIAAGAGDEQQGRPRAGLLVIDLDAVHAGSGHSTSPLRRQQRSIT